VQTDRKELGETDGHMEDELERAFDRTVQEGIRRLHRSWREVLVTGFFGGTEVAVGVLAFLAVRQATGRPLLVSWRCCSARASCSPRVSSSRS